VKAVQTRSETKAKKKEKLKEDAVVVEGFPQLRVV